MAVVEALSQSRIDALFKAWSVRRLGPRWRKLHRLVYPAAILGALHYVMLAKGFQIEPLVYLAIILGLLVMRLPVTSFLIRFRQADSA